MSESLVLVRRIEAPVADVFAMMVDAEELRGWLGPRAFVVTELTADVRVGGVFRFRMRKNGGGDYGAKGVYREIVPDARVVLTWAWNEASPGEPLDRSETLLTLEVRAEGQATVLTLTHARLPDADSVTSHREGWTEALDKLVARAEEKKETGR